MNPTERFTGNIEEFLGEDYYKKESLAEESLLLTIKDVERVTFTIKDKAPETRLQLMFTEDGTKKLTLNKTNLRILGKHFGQDVANWIGQRVVLYVDDNVMFAGKPVGGLRLRVPKLRTRVPGEEPAESADGIPF